MEGIDPIGAVLRWVHISAAIVAIGGAAYARLALLPGCKASLDADVHEQLQDAVRVRWAKCVHVCIFLLLATGLLNFYRLVIRGTVEPMPYHALFGLKVLLALSVFFISAALVGRAPGFAKMRQANSRWLSVLLAMAAVIILISGLLGQLRA